MNKVRKATIALRASMSSEDENFDKTPQKESLKVFNEKQYKSSIASKPDSDALRSADFKR